MITRKVNTADYGFSIIQVETFPVCNMNCRFCAYPLKRDKKSFLEDAIVRQILDSIDIDDRFEYVSLSHFNEPLLDKRIYSFIAYARERKIPVLIITNGLEFASRQTQERLLASSPDCIKISMQNLEGGRFNYSRGIKASFESYRDNILDFLCLAKGLRSRVTIDIGYSGLSRAELMVKSLFGLEAGDPSMPETLDDLRPLVKDFLDELKSKDPSFQFDSKLIASHVRRLTGDYLGQYGFKICGNIDMKFKKFCYGKRLRDFFPLRSGIGCPTRILSIMSSGVVVPCSHAYNDMHDMGNIRQSSLSSILRNNEAFLGGLRSGRHLNETCSRCLGAPTRRGVLFREAAASAVTFRNRLKGLKRK